jgi:hypothetical protein
MPDPAPIDLTTNTATTGYTEAQDGTWSTLTYPPFMAGGVKGFGSTPIAYSIQDIDTLFTALWNTGQTGATTMAGPPPYQLDAIQNHKNPKEKTILLFVTDGADTCAGSGDDAALTAANAAKNLYLPVVNVPGRGRQQSTRRAGQRTTTGLPGFLEPAASVQTFMIGYGDGVASPADVNRLNWIAWGGSGLNTNFPGADQNNNTNTNTNLKALKDQCSTCRDAFIAPDASTLRTQLQGIINQGAQDADFNAQQSVTESIFEYVSLADATQYDAAAPVGRYQALVPTKFSSSFSLPGFNGHLRAYQNNGGVAVERWNAGEKLRQLVTSGMATCNTTTGGGGAGSAFTGLHAGRATPRSPPRPRPSEARLHHEPERRLHLQRRRPGEPDLDAAAAVTPLAPARRDHPADNITAQPRRAWSPHGLRHRRWSHGHPERPADGQGLPGTGAARGGTPSCSASTDAEKAKAARREARG